MLYVGGLSFVAGSNHKFGNDGPPQKSYFHPSGGSKDQEFNQLKYVCRQLCYETTCLEFELNWLFFVGPSVEHDGVWHPARACADFLNECTPQKRSYIHHLDLCLEWTPKNESKEPNQPTNHPQDYSTILAENSACFETIAKFCHDYPNASVSYVIDDFRTGGCGPSIRNCLQQGILASLALRHKDFLHLLPNAGELAIPIEYARRWANRRCVERLKVSNLDFPGCEAPNDKEIVVMQSESQGWSLTVDKIQACVDLLKHWDDHGL